MAKATVKDGVLFIELPYSEAGKKTASKRNVRHATTEPDGLFVTVGNKRVQVQVNAWSPVNGQA